ncbi:PREDICTED: uncharacterized protein LOC105974002 [Erythranthe guttata]|uniref:uncharacterized protein LOC105974002 n=1 Tax=Erythranthe guttata TaxID=4155 RepID=UPI00064D77C2|nr:PREDICTED: uncharacterized protein LOC105974002 [Erythranthe guttata]|eukprot:XP_012854500.1 PREDICTED: uncharacterized protein LOC105974002 [Erythranthe guttata]
MAGIEKQKFQILDVTGSNFLSWCLDIKLHLQGLDLVKALDCVDIKEANRKDEANAMIFIRHHLSEDLKDEYIQLERPSEIWQKLKERFDHTKTVILPQAQYNWQHLRLQDFKSVADYNSALFKLESRLALCGVKISEYDKLEKTFSTMHASNLVLQQQYRQRQFKTYSELISVLLTAEKTNELLLKNHDLRPCGSQAVPEAHANQNRNMGRFRGRGRKFWRGARRGGGRGPPQDARNNDRGGYEYPRRNNNNTVWQRQPFQAKRDKGKMPAERIPENMCIRCGMTGHWAKVCRTAQHLVNLYQDSKRDKGKNVQANVTEAEMPLAVLEASTSGSMLDQDPAQDGASLELSDFFTDLDPLV